MPDSFNTERDKQLVAMEQQELGAIRSMLIRLNQLRSNVVARIAEAGSFVRNIGKMRQAESQVNQEIASFTREAIQEMDANLEEAFTAGQNLVDKPLVSMGIKPSAITVPLEIMNAEKFYSAKLITNLTTDARKQISSILIQASRGAISVQEAIDAVGTSLDSPSVFKSIAARAETIVRTEVLRMQAQATQLRMEDRNRQLASSGYELLKAWLDTPDARTRFTHRVAALRYAKENAIPIDEEFIVGGEACLYPRDPRLSAEEAVN